MTIQEEFQKYAMLLRVIINSEGYAAVMEEGDDLMMFLSRHSINEKYKQKWVQTHAKRTDHQPK